MPRLPIADHQPALAPRPEAILRRAEQSRAAGRTAEARSLAERAASLDPTNVAAHMLVGQIDEDEQRWAAALFRYDTVLTLDPSHVLAWLRRSNVAACLGDAAGALEGFNRLIALEPAEDMHWLRRSAALFWLSRYKDASAGLARIEDRWPGDPGILNLQAGILQATGRYREAMEAFGRAVASRPDLLPVRVNRAYLTLLLGDLTRGFQELDLRLRLPGLDEPVRRFTQPPWDGTASIADKTLLLVAEQGHGDTLQFCRYAALAQARGARVVMEVHPSLVGLLRSVPGVASVVPFGDVPPEHDFYIPMMSLPRAFGTTLTTIPRDGPYVFADPGKVCVWRERLAGLPRPLVGLVWAGMARAGSAELMATDARRSISLAALGPLAASANVTFISLQLGSPAAQAATPPSGMMLHDPTAGIADFADTAALVETLDLAITVDTAVVHLAGAMGKPVWLLNRFDTCWRWLLEREDSPWYPSLRQFRQPAPGDWPSVIAEVAGALHRFTQGPGDISRPDDSGY